MECFTNEIESSIEKNDKHILSLNRMSRYYSDFSTKLKILNDSAVLNSKKKRSSFKSKLQLKNSFNRFTYYQGVAELLMWIFCLENKLDFELDKKVSGENRMDVDVQIVHNNFLFNIEVKCPEFEVREEDTLHISNGFRTVSKEQLDEAIGEVKNMILDNLHGDDTDYSKISSFKISDNKLVDYLKSGQDKFPSPSDNVLNIVVVAVRSNDLQRYWEYLYNGYSGLFTMNSFQSVDNYSKVDAILLTNLIEGHESPSEEYNAWEMKNYCNLLCFNPFKIENNRLDVKHKAFLELFPNSTEEFEIYYGRFMEAISHELVPGLECLLFPHYMDEHHPLQWTK